MCFMIGYLIRGLSVSRRANHGNKKSRGQNLPKALAALIKNTRTQRRPLSLTEIATWLDMAINGLGSLKEVAERIGLSTKMLRQFQYVQKLSPNVQTLFGQRKLDSVDAAVHLSLLSAQDQTVVAQEIAEGQVDSADVRAITELRKKLPKVNIDEIIERVKATKNVRQYVAEFVVRSKNTTPVSLREKFARTIGAENILSINIKGSIGTLKMTAQGRDHLQKAANAKGLSKAAMVALIVRGEGKLE